MFLSFKGSPGEKKLSVDCHFSSQSSLFGYSRIRRCVLNTSPCVLNNRLLVGCNFCSVDLTLIFVMREKAIRMIKATNPIRNTCIVGRNVPQ